MSNLVPRMDFLLQSLTRRTRDCPHCRAPGQVVGRKHVFIRIRKCEHCQLYFTDPVYRPRLRSLYQRLYRAEGWTTRLPDRQQLARLKASGFAGTDKDAAERLRRLQRGGAGKRLLEIGSSWGYFLLQAQNHGFDPTGIEISAPRREFGVGELDVDIAASFEELGEAVFDCVYTAHALEHFTDLSTVFADIAQRLRPGGLLIIEVPRVVSPGAGSRRRARWSALGAVHPLGFTPSFFQTTLPRYGFAGIELFDGWKHYPEHAAHPASPSESSEVLCVARRSASSECAA